MTLFPRFYQERLCQKTFTWLKHCNAAELYSFLSNRLIQPYLIPILAWYYLHRMLPSEAQLRDRLDKGWISLPYRYLKPTSSSGEKGTMMWETVRGTPLVFSTDQGTKMIHFFYILPPPIPSIFRIGAVAYIQDDRRDYATESVLEIVQSVIENSHEKVRLIGVANLWFNL